uniref:Uncharacterized protein n=1 Tax=Timema douglasi TaxID=61478 RepID=A0A7R8VQX9_TIMDO|nr:unnamed protein product [Timema douglasi]
MVEPNVQVCVESYGTNNPMANYIQRTRGKERSSLHFRRESTRRRKTTLQLGMKASKVSSLHICQMTVPDDHLINICQMTVPDDHLINIGQMTVPDDHLINIGQMTVPDDHLINICQMTVPDDHLINICQMTVPDDHPNNPDPETNLTAPIYKGSEPAFAWRESGKPFRKNTASSPNRDSSLNRQSGSTRNQRDSQLRHQSGFTNVLRERLGPTPTFRTAAEIDHGAELITSAIKGSLEASTPRHRPKRAPQASLPDSILRHVREKNRLRKAWQVSRDPVDKANWSRKVHAVREMVREYRNSVWEDKIESLCVQDRSLWQMTRNLMRVPAPRPPIVGRNGVANSDKEKADALAEHLEAQFMVDPLSNIFYRVTSVAMRIKRQTLMV